MTNAAFAIPDTELMLQLQAGSLESMSVLCDRHWDRLVIFIQGIVRNRAAAEELAQETFLRVYLSRGRYEPTARFSTWLYRIATNRALNFLRDNKSSALVSSLDESKPDGVVRQIPDAGAMPEEVLQASQRRQILRGLVQEALETLPDRQRQAVVLHRYQELSYEEIGRRLGCSVPSVKSLLWRAYSTLRVRLEPALASAAL